MSLEEYSAHGRSFDHVSNQHILAGVREVISSGL